MNTATSKLSAPVWVGLLSTIGLAMQTGVAMVVYIDEAVHRRVRRGPVVGAIPSWARE